MTMLLNRLVVVAIVVCAVSACAPAPTQIGTIAAPTDPLRTSMPVLTQPPPTTMPKPIPTIPSSEEFHINPIQGLNPDFIMGADVSMLSQIEENGGKFYDAGVEGDALEILKNHGVNWIRLRIWNDPTGPGGNPLGGGNNDLQRTVEIAARAKSLGLKFLLDFHYSDWWADPGKQNMPKAWKDFDADQLNQAVYDYTAEVIDALANAGALPDMVQIGNEVNGGMMWPAGKTWSEGGEIIGGYDGFANLLSNGIQAVRDNDPNKDDPQKKIRIAIHLADGGDNDLYRTVFDELTKRNVDFDIIGLSYYSFWHGPLDNFASNMIDVSARYNKDVVVLEAAYPYTTEDADGHPNIAGGGLLDSGAYKATVQGQATALRDIMVAVAQVPNGRGLGVFYWEPEWIAVEGAGWAAGEGNAWENSAMFDFEGNALPSLDVFNLVRPEAGNASVPPQVVEISPIDVFVPLRESPALPSTVKVIFSDDAIREVPVDWDSYPPPLLDKVGNFKLNGRIDGTDAYAVATIYTGSAKNFAQNSGFENGAEGWVIEQNVTAVDISDEAQNVLNGNHALHYWAEGPFEFTVYQTITGLENGTYSFNIWMQGGGQDTLQLFASEYGGEMLAVDFEARGWREWQNPVIENIVVTNGQVTIGLRVSSSGGTWGFFDDAGLFLAE